MNITRENTGKQTSTVRIEIMPDDYREKVLKVLKDLQRKANLPGFRPGKVPFGHVRKMYGRAVLADEINKLLSETLASYIRDEKIEILGNPLPNIEKTPPVDFEKQESFEFFFDLGEAPEIKLNLAASTPVDRYVITVDDGMVDRYIEESRRRQGTSSHPDTSWKEDMISGEVAEVDADGKPLENGVRKNVFLNPGQIRSEKTSRMLEGLSKEGKLVFSPPDLFDSIPDAVQHLGISREKAEEAGIRFELSVKDIFHTEPAGMGKEFYEKVYPGKNIETEEDFREHVRADASGSFSGEADKFFYRQASAMLIRETEVPLPDEFLKRWLAEQKDNKMSPEEIGKQYPAFSDSMRWQLIENKLIRDHGLTVSDDDIRKYIRDYFLKQIPLDPEDPEVGKRYDSLVDTVMKNEEQVRKINDEIYTVRLLQLLKSQLPAREKVVGYEEFIKLASAFHGHEQDHDHDHDHDHEHQHEHNH